VRRHQRAAVEHKDVHAMIYDIMNDGQRKFYEGKTSSATSRSPCRTWPASGERVVQQRGAAAVMGDIPVEDPVARDLKCPGIFKEIADQPRGIVLVTGRPARQVDDARGDGQPHQRERARPHSHHRGPDQFVHESKKCLINQREVGPHTLSFANALRSALREDPE